MTLVLGQTRLVNTSFMMKATWNADKDMENLWVKVMRTKYKFGNNMILKIKRFTNEFFF